MKTIDMNFVDATVLKGKRFETKQNFDFKSDIYTNKHFNILISVSTHNPSILKYILSPKTSRHLRNIIFNMKKRFK